MCHNRINQKVNIEGDRLIIEPNATQDTIMICTEIEVEGVSDYHGSKENWYIP